MKNLEIFKTQSLNDRISEVVEKIVTNYNPTKVFLFGSFARGTFDPETSEMDILIIGECEMRFMDRIKNLRILCTGGEPHINPLMYTTSEIAQLEEDGEGFVEDIMDEGILLYDSNLG